MPPIAALALWICLVVILLTLDRRWRPAMSPGDWIPFIWVLIIGSRPLTAWLHPEDINSLDALYEGSPLDRNLQLMLIVAGIIVLASRQFSWLRFARDNKWVVAFFLYLGLSILWSDYTFIAFKRWVKDIGNLTMVLIVVTGANPIAAVQGILVRSAYVLLPLSVVLIKYFPELSRYYEPWTGRVYFSAVGTDKNMLGMTLTALGLALVWALIDTMRRRGSIKWMEVGAYVSLLAMVVWLLKLGDSATARACTAFGILFLVLLCRDAVRRHIRFLLVAGVSCLALFSVPEVQSFVLEPILGLLGREISFTGRDQVWRAVLAQDINPLFGVGAYSFWMGERVAKPLPGIDGWANTAHNAYLEVYANVGLVGVALYLAILVTAGNRLTRDVGQVKDEHLLGKSFCLAFLITAVVYGATEAVVRLNLLWFGLLLVVCVSSRKRSDPLNQGGRLRPPYPGGGVSHLARR